MAILHDSRTDFSASYLDNLCEMPQPQRSLEDWERRRHLDLPQFTDEQLATEGRQARRRADYDHDEIRRAWFIERIRAVRHELNRRSNPTTTRSKNDSPIPKPLRDREWGNNPKRVAGVRLVGGKIVSE